MTTQQQPCLNFEPRTEQQRQIKRVGGRIGEIVLEFCRTWYRKQGQAEFHMRLVFEYVDQRSGKHVAPDSSRRIFNLLKATGCIDYELVSRSQSLYRITRVG